MTLTEQPLLYELYEHGRDVGMVVGGLCLDAQYFEDQAEAAGHDTEVLVPLADTALRLALVTDPDN